ncbi:MAG: NADH-quinone oxidoreductase subunit G [Actinomycetes bacterium]
MTLTNNEVSTSVEMISVTIDGFEVTVPKGTLIIRAAEMLGIQVPRFCDHPLLDPVGACRQCLVDVEINGRAFPKPQASCTMPVENGMVVKTHLTSPVAAKAQQGVMELLLINHPLDCPVCDKGGECPLQNQAMSTGRGESRFSGVKRTFPKPINISSQVLLDRERCVLCARCTRFSDQIAGDPFITLNERGALQQVGIYEKEPFASYFSGNTVQICPVGALTGAAYRFRSRPFDLVSTPSVCEHCASGCALRTDVRRGVVLRRLAGDDAQVNQEWNCDKGRWAFQYATAKNRLTSPMVRVDGRLVTTSWPDALAIAATALAGKSAAVLTGGRLTVEDAYAYQKFARTVLGTNDIDFRARISSDEERSFLGQIAGTSTTYADIDAANHVVLVALEPEEESPIVFLRLRSNVRKDQLAVTTLAPFSSPGSKKLEAKVISSDAPGALAGLSLDSSSVILVGERAARTPGLYAAVLDAAKKSGAKIGWVPRRAGERGALEAGALGTLLPGGRPVAEASARLDMSTAWDSPSLPVEIGRSADEIIAAASQGTLHSLVIAGVDANDLPIDARAALTKAFVVSFEIRESSITDYADVVFPVAAVVEKSGTFIDWEGRERSFDRVLDDVSKFSDVRVLAMLAKEMKQSLGFADTAAAGKEFRALGTWDGARAAAPTPAPHEVSQGGNAKLISWRLLLDLGSLQEEEPHLAGTARKAIARLSSATAQKHGIGTSIKISGEDGTLILPVEITEMPEDLVWVPENSINSQVRTLGTSARVTIGAAS